MKGQATSVVVASSWGRPGSNAGEAGGRRRHLRGAVSSWTPLLRMSPQLAGWLRRPLNKGTLIQGILPHIGSHQAPGPWTGKGCSTQPQGGLWKQPAMTCSPRPGLGLHSCLPPAAWVSVLCIRPGLLNVGTTIRLDSGKISLCLFNKYSQRISSLPGPGLTTKM